ncbi:unnamed protein product [Bursaphelenchus okinawaensis]|uniref:ANK_REP_REGION domain-containing protein n=1 Tax=Bursaphelenchus okinawaensis TaxID=465554 RepID=A0A811JUG8_9BILA|nr:unnamed protein product [Bursaphelenchus okinawaensis]CAG9084121.1 unnamed protein product [Bursaphelenchus okinawaensis]
MQSVDDVLAATDRFEQLKEAIRSSDQVWVMNILSSGFNVNFVDEMGATALHYVAREGSVGMVNILLTQGAKPDIVDSLGFTPFLIASRYGHLQVVKRLLAAGVDLNRTTLLGINAQVLADLGGHPHVVAALHNNTLAAAECLQLAREKFAGIKDDSLVFSKNTVSTRRRSILGILRPNQLKISRR